MMDFEDLFLSSEGYLNRKGWWLGSIGLVIISLLAISVIGLVLGLFGLWKPGIVQFSVNLAFLAVTSWVGYNLAVKRLRDRDRPLSFALIFIGAGVISQLLQMLGVTGSVRMTEFFGTQMPMFQANMFGQVVNIIYFGLMIWALIELGILPGRAPAEQTVEPTDQDGNWS